LKHPELKPTKGAKKAAAVAMHATVRRTEIHEDSIGKIDPSFWFLDSGASDHFSPHRDLFETFQVLDRPCEIETAEGTTYGTATGRITIAVIAGRVTREVTLNNVVYAPKMDANLLSTAKLYDLGYEVSMKPGKGVNIYKENMLVSNTMRYGNLFRLKTIGQNSKAYTAMATHVVSIDVWHRRLGHLNKDSVLKLEKLADGVNIDKNSEFGICGPCQEGKQHRQPSMSRRKGHHWPSTSSTVIYAVQSRQQQWEETINFAHFGHTVFIKHNA
jgi:hypothetical protein